MVEPVSLRPAVLALSVSAFSLLLAQPAAFATRSAMRLQPAARMSAGQVKPGSELWVRRYNGPWNGRDIPTAVGVSPDGATVFVTGDSTSSTKPHDYATVAYHASTGRRLWVARYNGPRNGDDNPAALEVSPDGSRVFVTGFGSGNYATVSYDAATGTQLWVENGPGNGYGEATALGVSPDGSRVFVTGFSESATGDYATVAYDATTGATLWTKRYNGPGNNFDRATALGVSPDGSTVLVTGQSVGSTSSSDYATVAYDASTGARLWTERYNGPGNGSDQALALGMSPDGSAVFVTGGSAGSSNDYDYATVAYDISTGDTLWTKRYDGPGNGFDIATALRVSPNETRVFVTGHSASSTSPNDYATVSYDASSGAQLWAKRYKGPGDHDDVATALGVSPDGSRVFVTGFSYGSTSADDYATVSYDASSGVTLWTKRYNGVGNGYDRATALGVSPDGATVYVTGESPGLGGTGHYATVAYAAA